MAGCAKDKIQAAPRDLWDPAELAYSAEFTAGPTTRLTLQRHDGGQLDWWSMDATGPVPPPARLPEPARVLANRVRYPGAPNPRWWQIEQAGTDLGTYAPDRSHFATLLLLELVTSHSDDWFTFPVAAGGHVVTLHEAVVVDAFGDRWPLEPPDDGWSLFAVTGLDPRSLVLWAAVTAALTGPVIDQVDLGWTRTPPWCGRSSGASAGATCPPQSARRRRRPPTGPSRARSPGTRTGRAPRSPPFWHPYLLEPGRRRLVQGRLADLSGAAARLMPPPRSDLLRDPASGGRHPVHQLEPAAVPTDGLQIERRYVLGRRTDGLPVLWTQRRRVPLAAPPTLRLQFDAMEPA